jgi:hypothetical protein
MHYPARALDAVPPPPPAAVAAADLYPRNAREKELCEDASKPDWLYLAIPPVLVAGAIVLDTQVFKNDPNVFTRELGPSFIGLTWGMLVGSFYPSLPKCSPHFASTAPPEGQVRTAWPIALSFALLAGMTAPIVDYIAIGPVPDAWPTEERVARVILAGAVGFGAALIPYLLPPKPLRASRQLIDIRPTVSAHSTFVSCAIRF